MSAKEFTGLVKPSKCRDPIRPLLLSFILKDGFRLETLLLFGAVLQTILFIFLPPTIAVLPAVLLALHSILITVQQCLSPSSNYFMDDVLPGRTTSQLPDFLTARFGTAPAAQPLVVFHFGVRFNHPLGVLSPGALESINFFRAMAKELTSPAGIEQYGMLGMTRWRGGYRDTNETLLFVFYFRNVEGLQRFAHDPVHREAWEWLAKRGGGHIAAFHETFVVPTGGYETVYLDCAPTLMGASHVKCVDQEKPDKEVWVRPLVSADTPALRSMVSRLGRET